MTNDDDFMEFNRRTDTIDFEVYDPNGVLLARIPANLRIYGFVVQDDRVYIGDREDASMSEYRIVEK